MIGTLRNVFLPPPPSVVAVQIPGRAPVDYFEPVVGGAEERRGGPGSNSVAPFDGGKRGRSNQERNSRTAVVKRLHNALAKESCPSFQCKQFFFL